MGRLWRGMGGMGRPEPQSAHHPHRQHAHSGFHETRDPKHETRLLPGARRGVPSGPARIPRFSRNTRHETRLFFESRPFCRVGRQVMREGGQARRLQGWMYEARENEWKGVFLNPETGITTFSESRFGSRFGIRHNSSQFVGKIRISPYRQSSAPAHCGNRDIDFMDASRPSVTFPGPQVSPSGDVKGGRVTNRETQPLTRRAAQASANSEVFTKHESRDTNHGLYASLPTISRDFPRFPGISRPPHPPIKCPCAVRRSSRRPPGCLRTGESPLSHAEKEECFELRCPASACGAVLDQRYNLASLHFSPRGEAKCVRGPSGRGASRLARAGVLEQYVEHGKQAQRSPGGRIACFDCRVVRNAG